MASTRVVSEVRITNAFVPPAPKTVDETGLGVGIIGDLVLKTLYHEGYLQGLRIAEEVCLPFTGVLDAVLDFLRRDRLIEVKGATGSIRQPAYEYAITELGASRARELLNRSQYVGPAPVTLEDYRLGVKAQSVRNVFVTPSQVRETLSHLVLNDEIIDRVGPAINSGSSMFLFGPPGNGKTSIAEAIGQVFLKGSIYIPHCISIGGQVVKVFDPVTHQRVADDENDRTIDRRWVKVKRPTIQVGGELTLESLDLIFNEVALYYEAPFQIKANGGMLLIDDFGRQLARPSDLLNRWIVPLEKRLDYLTLHTGRKIEVPFDVLLIFSTNLAPQELVDEAFLRRIRHKIEIHDPTYDQYREIFRRACLSRGVAYDDRGLAYLLQEHYIKPGIRLRACHPRDLLDQLTEIARYRGVPTLLSPELIDQAWDAYYVDFQSTS